MAEDRTAATPLGNNPAATKPGGSPGTGLDEAYHLLRRLAGVGYQLRAATRAGDRFLAQDASEDRDTGVWLISCAVTLAEDITADLDGLARTWKPRASDAGMSQALTKLRTRAHQLHAATRAADHFLDQDSSEDKGTGSWLVACALGLADKLAGEAEDLASALKRAAGETGAAPDAAVRRPPSPAAAAVRAAVQSI
ncbi:hypothetical protein [Ideonella sp. BN130291]|uniref:hypothetical protein n=1 Tax=Ideonella sp. BN130291 TaxID=3112940 RepID=UPI002E26050C|nr:hypothetical protein [Ideonella sp. BN130291]